ncbi:MAG TPA: glycogen synthase [Thermoanaerobaculia bacterium]|nr:glycogen synthase [Thermoanaerobaculia bacterium]
MKVCVVTSELAPLARTGGLGEAVSGLCRFLHGRGIDLRIFLPRYAACELRGEPVAPVEPLQGLEVELGGERVGYSVDATRLPGGGPGVHLVRCPRYYDRSGLYDDRGDEHLRFALLTRAALESCRRTGFGPDVLHLHDWHAALAPLYLRTCCRDPVFADSRTLLTIHNLAYQGVFPARALAEVGLAGASDLVDGGDLAADRISFLASGIRHADALSTVSETHAREIQTPEQGFGLDGLLRARADRLTGIVNGVDYAEWDPRTDPLIAHRYSPDDLAGKELDKRALLESLGLPWRERVPVLAVISRLVEQKGFDLLFRPLPELLERRDVRLVALGTGEPRYEELFHSLRRRFPHRASFFRGFDERLAHQIQAGSDLFLMPSRFEPCGLAQLYALRYGTPPVVRRTGGLADTVEPFDPVTGRGTGFVFDHFDADSVRWALDHALDTHADPTLWELLVRNGMTRDFSWDRQGERYLELYRRLAGGTLAGE